MTSEGDRMLNSTKNKKKKKSKGTIGSIVIIFVALLVLGGYYLVNSKDVLIDDIDEQTTFAQELLLRNLETNYPPSPKEVIRYYSDISQCFYEDYSEEEIEALAKKSRELLDEQLYNEQTDEEYLNQLKEQINYFKEKGVTISSYALSPSVDVEYFNEDGYSFARLYCIYSLRDETKIVATEELFLLREDEEGHWKIFGFALTKDEE